MKKLYLTRCMISCTFIFSSYQSQAQNCNLLQANCRPYESRCTATGAIKVNASGGSGNYKYKVTGPVNTNFTSLDSITGLSAGTYSVVITDITTNCSLTISNVIIPGTYQDPRFSLRKTDVSCDNGSNGSVRADSIQFGRQPYSFRIIAPSPSGVGTTNSSGIFNGLPAGDYTIQMTDSCGGIQTRRITINNYTWRIDAYPFTQNSCNNASGFIRVTDSRGNSSTSGSGLPGFTYGIVRAPGDTIWSSNPNFSFALNGHRSFQVVARDSCGIIKTGATTVSFIPSVNANVSLSNFTCNRFNATVTGTVNMFAPVYCLFDQNGNQLSCNNNGAFTGLAYGNYCIQVHDSCADTTITRCFTANQPPISVSGTIIIRDKTCTSFTASIGSSNGLTNPRFCLLDSTGTEISCNATGNFPGLSYGSYCIRVDDGCRDTSFLRCFNASPPRPVLHPLAPSYMNCQVFGMTVTGDSLSNPVFCLVDSSGAVLECNNTGIFNDVPYGNYCVQMYDSCYQVTLTQCINLPGPTIQNDLTVHTEYIRCRLFNVTVHTSNMNNEYCLFDANGQTVACNSTGIFTNVPAGTYCVESRLACPDTVLRTCFRLAGPVPSVGASPSITGVTCTRFNVSIPRQDNLTNPQFCLYNDRDSLIACNQNGQFNNLPFGSYCIRITTPCYDTTITRCFSRWPSPVSVSVSARKSCAYGFARLSISLGSTILPASVAVYNPDGSLLMQRIINSNSYTIDSLQGTAAGLRYKVVVTDQCGRKDSAYSSATASSFTHSVTVVPKCPSGVWANGSGNIRATAVTNMGRLTVRIIRKNGVNYSPALTPNSASGGNFLFNDLGPGTYIIRYVEDDCNRNIYDTVVIRPYQFPNLSRSTAYQCDQNGFSVSAVASNGVGPYMYEVIGSVPAAPSIISGPQPNPIFNINNGNTYSLIRLRAVDACGNATLGDASILPLANNGIIASSNCFANPTTLHVDSIFGATYTWYRKDSLMAHDSTLVSTQSIVSIPILSAADTGIYICHVVVNNGCIKRTYRFNLNGLCYSVLPGQSIVLKGRHEMSRNLLFWDGISQASCMIERKSAGGQFEALGSIDMGNSGRFTFSDENPPAGISYYRLKITEPGMRPYYSNWVSLGSDEKMSIQVYPNPASESFRLSWDETQAKNLTIMLKSLSMQTLAGWKISPGNNGSVLLQRPPGLMSGMYFLVITQTETGYTETRKIIFR